MATVTDARFESLRTQGFTGAMPEMTLQWLQANGATSPAIADAWGEMLAAQSFPLGQVNDAWYALLDGLAPPEIGRQLNDLQLWFWTPIGAGGGGGIIGGGFTPADLFQSGEEGGYYDPSNISTLWQDVAGTIPVTANGDPVRRIDDLSGNGNDAQAEGISNPTFQSGGLVTVAGADQGLRTQTYAANFTDPASIGVAVTTGTVQANNIVGGSAATTGNMGLRWDGSGEISAASFHNLINPTIVPINTDVVAVSLYTAPGGYVRVNGAETIGSNGIQSLTSSHILCAGFDNTICFDGTLLGIVIIDRTLTTQELADLEAWLQSKIP